MPSLQSVSTYRLIVLPPTFSHCRKFLCILIISPWKYKGSWLLWNRPISSWFNLFFLLDVFILSSTTLRAEVEHTNIRYFRHRRKRWEQRRWRAVQSHPLGAWSLQGKESYSGTGSNWSWLWCHKSCLLLI